MSTHSLIIRKKNNWNVQLVLKFRPVSNWLLCLMFNFSYTKIFRFSDNFSPDSLLEMVSWYVGMCEFMRSGRKCLRSLCRVWSHVPYEYISPGLVSALSLFCDFPSTLGGVVWSTDLLPYRTSSPCYSKLVGARAPARLCHFWISSMS